MSENLLNDIKKVLKALLVSSAKTTNGIPVRTLLRDYQDLEGREIPFEQLGFLSAFSLLNSIRDTLFIAPQYGTPYAFPVVSKENQHISKMVSNQKTHNRSSNKSRITPPFCVKPKHPDCFSNRINSDNGQKSNRFLGIQQAAKLPIPSRQYQSHWNGRKVANQRNFQTTNYDRARKEPLSKTNDWSEIETVDISQHNRNSCSNIIKPNVNADKHDEIASNRNLQATQNQINEMKVENKLNGSLNNLNRHSVPHLIEDQSYDVYESHDNNNTNKIQITLNCLDNININMDSFSDHFSRYKLSSTLSHSISINDELNEHDALPNLEADDYYELNSDGIVVHESSIRKHNLNEWKIGSTLKLYISEVFNPFKFWFQQYYLTDELDTLMYRLQFYYEHLKSDEFSIPKNNIKNGLLCAALYQKTWHRGKIVDVLDDDTLKVFYIDYGTVDDVFNNEIKFLHEDFIYLPPQAIRGCLDHVKPIGGSWSRDASQAFHHIVADYSLYGKITGINTDENIFYMMLIDTSQEYDINIADMLIDRDYADIQDTPIVQLHKRQYSEVYPSFDMLENSEYPSYQEIGEMLHLGYDLAIYETSILIP